MATEDVRAMLEDCANKLNIKTRHTENFLELQDDVAADFTSLTKVLYDFHKGQEPGDCKSSPLEQLVVEDFDEEQIWQELELQNTAVLRHFETVVNDIISDDALTILEEEKDEDNNIDEEMAEDIGEEEEEEPHKKPKKQCEDGEGDFTDEDSDLDFDVDALEKREKLRKRAVGKASKAAGVPSEVDDKFFKLSEMESFLDDMDKQEGKEGVEDIDYFQDLPSDDDDDLDLDEDVSFKKQKKHGALKSSRNLKYKDFFDAVEGESGKADHQSEDEDDSMDGMQEDPEEEDEDDEDEDTIKEKEMRQKKVTFNLSGEEESEGEESEGEDIEDILGKKEPNSEKSAYKSSFEKRQEKMKEKIQELEKSALGEKPWQLSGEATAQTRPENSMLEEDVQFDQASRLAPAVTEETTLLLEDIIKQRIKDQVFDDVVRKNKPKEDAFEYKKRLTLDHEKSKLSLAQVYEKEYLKMTQEKTDEVEKPAHVEIQKLMDTLFLKLDALSNFHFTPKPPVPEVKVVSNLPSIAMEEVAPVSASDATLLAPEEVKEKSQAGDVLGDSEKTSTDKKRERRKKKTVKRIKIKEKEKRQKEKEASLATRGGENKKQTKAEVAQNLQKITKGGKAKILKDEGKDKAVRSSQAFFSQLQDQVKSQIKSVKDQALKKKKKLKEVSVGKLKL